jgi:polar amino acid transport system permease protein
MTVLNILMEYREGFFSGLIVTLNLCLIVWTVGILGGAMLGFAGAKWYGEIGTASRIVSFILSGTPILVLLFWLHYPLQAQLRLVINPFYTAVAALSIVNIFAVSDIVRNTLRDFPQQYIIAAKVCGLSPVDIALDIQLPIVLRQVLPGLLTLQVNMLQSTLFASLISVDEIFRVAQRINATIYKPVEIYTALALFFIAICLPINGLALWLKQRFTRDISD